MDYENQDKVMSHAYNDITKDIDNKIKEIKDKKSIWWLIVAIVVGIISVFIIGVGVASASSFGDSSASFGYFGFVVFSIVFGLLFNFLLDKYSDNINFRLKGSSIVTVLCGIIFIPIANIMNHLADATRELASDPTREMGSMMGNVYANEFISVIIIVLCFNLSNIIMIINSKEYKKLLKLLIPIILGIGIGFLLFYYISSSFLPTA